MDDSIIKNGSNDSELDDELKKKVKKMYPNCLSCGETNKRLLEVDHINPRYFGGTDNEDNLQTLCRYCNISKNILEIDFRIHKSPLNEPPHEFKIFNPPRSHELEDETWQKYIKRLINQFYCSCAVENVILDDNKWKIELYDGNNPKWIKPHLNELLDEITILRNQINLKAPDQITIK